MSEFKSVYCKVFNGRKALLVPEHFCLDAATGRRCHPDNESVFRDAMWCVSFLLMIFDPSAKPSDKSFFKNIQSLRAWACGIATHQILPSALSTMCPLTNAERQVNVAILEQDDMKERRKKEIRPRCDLHHEPFDRYENCFGTQPYIAT